MPVRKAVATVELMCCMPIFAKTAVTPANIADPHAKSNHIFSSSPMHETDTLHPIRFQCILDVKGLPLIFLADD